MADAATEMSELLADYRKVIVLLADEKNLDEAERQSANTVGQALFHDKLAHEQALEAALSALVASGATNRIVRLEAVLDYIESEPTLFDADRLAFREALAALQAALKSDSSLPAIKLHKRIGEDLDALGEIEQNYDQEIQQIFSRFETRALVPKREKWNDYVAHLKTLFTREQILKDYGVIEAYRKSELPPEEVDRREIFGDKFPRKTVALTFDDGPHARYTDEIDAILTQYHVPAAFFEVGQNLGSIDAQGHARLGANASIARRLFGEGYAIGNHSFTHAQLSKLSGTALRDEIVNTDLLLQSVDPKRSPLFRFPYGAHSVEGLQLMAQENLRSVMWNIDSMDWADPVPSSIADRVLREVDRQGRGIILFHDIHDRAVKALPLILDRLVADDYAFAGWDGNGFSVKSDAQATARATVTTGYANSWAVVIGINDYSKWPKLQYAVSDADALRQTLVERFGFASERIITLEDAGATRSAILSAFHDKLGKNQLQKNDRVLVFFAGHGATRKLNSGREVGYIIPVDADPNELASDAIPMTEIQNIAESLVAKHVLFVMDACYSGLGLARGGSGGFMRENAKRLGRQMLTAGGADQMVADGGPSGHSIFTWTVLQGLDGKADLNGDGLITATELAAYVAPAVAGVSLQTPAFGSLPGSEGGDFVFEVPAQTEFLSADSTQLTSEAIALNAKLDAATPVTAPVAPGAAAAPVKVLDLQGQEQTLVPAPAVTASAHQLAQHANDRGLQLYKEKRYAEAGAQFTEALKLRPDFALAANNLGFLFYKQERYAEAARWYANAIQLDRSRAIAYLNLGDAYAHSGERDQAQQAYRTYLELAPSGAQVAYVKQQLESPAP
jgi:uncharacterized caspase-like protein/peptidoglycan/xylan/chitin deacetylase (PgdA/CDA1 family)